LDLVLGVDRTARQSQRGCGDYESDDLIDDDAAGDKRSTDRMECVQHALLP
jgi:hypothetical protein